MRWLRVGEKAWRDFWALLQVIHYSRYALFYFLFRRGEAISLHRLDLMIRNLLVYFRLEAKCSVLSYKTLLGTEHNGSERNTPCEMKKHTIFVFLLLIVYAMWRGGREGGFFLVQIALDRIVRWSAMVWDVIFIFQSSNPPCSFLTTIFFSLTLFTSLCSRSFLALVSATFVVTSSARSGITSTELQLYEPGVDAYQYLRLRPRGFIPAKW